MTTTKHNSTARSNPGRTPSRWQWRDHLIAVVVAVAAVGVTFWLARATGDQLVTRPEFGDGQPEALRLWVVLAATALIGGLLGAGTALAAQKFARNPRRTYLLIISFGLLIYGVLAFIRADSVATALWLNVMHLVAAVPIIGASQRGLTTQTA